MLKTKNERPLTKRTMDVHAAMLQEDYMSIRQIGDKVGMSSTSTVHMHLQRLVGRGLATRCDNYYKRGYKATPLGADHEDDWQYPTR